MAYIQERKTDDGKLHYRVQIRLKGFPTQCATFERKTDAKKWAQQTEAAIREGRHFKFVESKKHTLGKLIDRYIRDILPTKPKSQKKQTAQLTWWKEQLGHKLLSDITPALIAEYRDKLASENTYRGGLRSPATVVRYLAALSHAMTIAVNEWGWLDDSPLRKVTKPKEPRGRVRFLSGEERESLLIACKESQNPYLFTVVVMALATGMRHGEIIKLRWTDVDFERGRIVLHETKNGERRVVPLVGHAMEMLKGHQLNGKVCPMLIFPATKGQMGQKGQKHAQLRTAWLTALKKAGIHDFRFHDLRHSAASYLVMNRASLSEIAEVLGHKTLAMVKRYSHLSEAHTSKVVERMNQQIFGA